MNHEFRLADIGEGLEEAEIVRWLVNVGDQVTRDQPLVEVMTDKSNAELPAPAAGQVVALEGSVGDIVHVGGLIAVIQSDADDSAAPTPADDSRPAVAEPSVPPTTDSAVPAASAASSIRPKASPSTRRAAAERGIDLTTVTGSGPGGRILLTDLDQHQPDPKQPSPTAAPPAPAPVPSAPPPPPLRAPHGAVEPSQPLASLAPTIPAKTAATPAPSQPAIATGTIPLRGIRRVVAKNMQQSWTEIPHIHAFQECVAEPMLELRQSLRSSGVEHYAHLTPLSFFVAATAAALQHLPQAHASIDMVAETITYHEHVNIGIAVATERGLVVPVVHDAGRFRLGELCVAVNAAVSGARANTLDQDAYRGGTVTITNFGALGGDQATPLIRPPESLIVGFGAIKPRPIVIDGQVVTRTTLKSVIGADHRLVDGDLTTAVLTDVNARLTAPIGFLL